MTRSTLRTLSDGTVSIEAADPNLTDDELIAAYVKDAQSRAVGVDYWIGQEVKERGLTRRASRALAEASA